MKQRFIVGIALYALVTQGFAQVAPIPAQTPPSRRAIPSTSSGVRANPVRRRFPPRPRVQAAPSAMNPEAGSPVPETVNPVGTSMPAPRVVRPAPMRAYPPAAAPAVPNEPPQASAPPAPARPAAIDLSKLNNVDVSNPHQGPGVLGSSSSYGGYGFHPVSPHFRFYFDFWLIRRPGVTDLSFQNVHSISMVEIAPRSDVTFGFELRPDPRYYELAIQVSRRLKVKVGRIWIPFDDMNPHNNFGGRTNTQQLISGTTLFLPNIWTDLGVSAEYKLLETSKAEMTAALYVVNGFKSGGTSVKAGDTIYPAFVDTNTGFTEQDNNLDKAVGGRVQLGFGSRLSVGGSFYMQRYSNQEDEPLGIFLYGVDGRIRLGRAEVRAGYLGGSFGVLNGGEVQTAGKGGAYGELWYRWGKSEQFRFVARGGILQPDDRVISTNDQFAVGAGLFYRPDFIQYSIEHSQELKNDFERINTSITWARIAVSL